MTAPLSLLVTALLPVSDRSNSSHDTGPESPNGLSVPLHQNGVPRLSDGSRFVSITFDDGLIAGARKAAPILAETNLKATFYVVTGWVRPRLVPWIRDPYNRRRDHGCWDDWRQVAAAGHEVGSHTVTHLNLGGRLFRAFPPLLKWEARQSSRTIERRIGVRPASLSTPWNASASQLESAVRPCYEACRLGGSPVAYNDLARTDWYALRSWAPGSDVPIERFAEAITSIPANHWLILQFHSLDGEGYMPVASEKFAAVCRLIAAEPGLECLTVRDAAARLRQDG